MTADRIPDIVLERYHLNELPPADTVRVIEQLENDAQTRERLALLGRSDQELRDQVDRVRERLLGLAPPPSPPFGVRALWVVPAVAVFATVLIAVLARVTSPPAEDRIKGSSRSSIAVYRRTAEGSERLAEGAVARSGDVIRVAYGAAGRSHGVIVSVDGLGNVTMHLPPSGDKAASLKAGAAVLLDQAYELDDAPRWEQFYFVAADRAFDVGPVMQAARAAAHTVSGPPPARLALPAAFEQASFMLQKESRR